MTSMHTRETLINNHLFEKNYLVQEISAAGLMWTFCELIRVTGISHLIIWVESVIHNSKATRDGFNQLGHN